MEPRAKAHQIGTGDLLILHSGGVDWLEELGFVFATPPALAAYSAGAGNCAKATGSPDSCATVFSYPVPGPNIDPGSGPVTPGGLGTRGNGFPVKPSGNVDVTVALWRPQRTPIAPETGWIDVGGLSYGAQVGFGGVMCPDDAFSGPELSPESGHAGISDKAPDRSANPANTVTYTLKLSRCLSSSGLGSSFDGSDEEVGVTFQVFYPSQTAGGQASQTVFFKRQ